MRMNSLTDLLEKLKALDSKASPPDWHIGWVDHDSDKVTIDESDLSEVCSVPDRKNQAFICSMRNALPKLISVVEIYREALEYIAGRTSYRDLDETYKAREALAKAEGVIDGK